MLILKQLRAQIAEGRVEPAAVIDLLIEARKILGDIGIGTNTSKGRLTLDMLGCAAQFERELMPERLGVGENPVFRLLAGR